MQVPRAEEQELGRGRGLLPWQGWEGLREICDISGQGGKRQNVCQARVCVVGGAYQLKDFSGAELRGGWTVKQGLCVVVVVVSCMHAWILHLTSRLSHLFLYVQLRQGRLSNQPASFYPHLLKIPNPTGECSSLRTLYRNIWWRPWALPLIWVLVV